MAELVVVPETPDSGEIPRSLLEKVRAFLAAGEVVAIPTDTVYGLAVDPMVEGAVAKVFAVKGRPRRLQLPLLCADEDQVDGLADSWGGAAAELAARWWPGPLTLVVRRRAGWAASLGGDGSTIGVRVPSHRFVQSLSVEGPLATTSANLHGAAPFERAEDVLAVLGQEIALVVDGGLCQGAVSTVVDCTGSVPTLLRSGAISQKELEEALGREVATGAKGAGP